MSTLQEIEAAILGLSEQDRLHLADKILRSLPKPPGAMESEEILAEAFRRDQELENCYQGASFETRSLCALPEQTRSSSSVHP